MKKHNNKPIATKFIFTSCTLALNKKRADFCFKIEFKNRPSLNFTETLIFPKKIILKNIPSTLIINTLNDIHLILGVSYYKLYCPPKIVISQRSISKEQADFWNIVYKNGLGEFFYQNKINSKGLINFPYSKKAKPENFILNKNNKILLGIGGGKDSIVAGELLKEQNQEVTALLIETQKSSQISNNVVKTMDIPSLQIKRNLDQKLFTELEGAYNGHVPVSAIFAFIGYLSAILYGYSYVVVGNEHSSNFGNLKYLGEEINHQWSKSLEFELLFQNYTKTFLSDSITYFSLLRSFFEIRIAKMFSKYNKYFSLFSSCNRSFKVHKLRPEKLWCGECPKCLFVFTILSAFLKKKELIKIFGKNLYDDNNLVPMFKDILGFGKIKPFDCVGTFEEAQVALFLSKNNFSNSLIHKLFLNKISEPKKMAEKVFAVNFSPVLPTQFSLLGMENVLILGYGKEGKITEQYIKKYYPNIKIWLADRTISKDYLSLQKKFDLIIKTPGIPGRNINSPYITATNLFFSNINNVVIGITGSKGKSTTTSLIYNIFKNAGKDVKIVGNIGVPMLSLLLQPRSLNEIYIIELSSYQLDDIKYSPHVAVVLNFFPEHMDYHNGVEKYYRAKKNIIKYQHKNDFFIFNNQDKKLKTWQKDTLAQKIGFTKTPYLTKFKSKLKGKHNERNILAAIEVARLFKISNKVILKTIEDFEPLAHRLEFVGNFSDILFYDDAISTTPESTMMALQTIPNIGTLFLGGEDRGYDFTKLEKLIKKIGVKNIVLFPNSGAKMFKSKKGLNILETSDMKKAVAFAYRHTPKKMTCLLSMASPSYSLWKNFEEKGNLFQYWVKYLQPIKNLSKKRLNN